MKRFLQTTILLAAFCCNLAFPLSAQEMDTTLLDNSRSTNHLFTASPYTPTVDDGQIAYLTARLLYGLHYSHREFGDALSGEFLDRYISDLDPQHIHFIQADLDEFARYRTKLDDLTLGRAPNADISPAYEIFTRFMKRLEDRVNYSVELLKKEKFEFNDDERIVINRHELPYPKDLIEAQKLARERVRYDYLQEKLAQAENKQSVSKQPVSFRVDTNSPIFQQFQSEINETYPSATAPKTESKKSPAEQIVETLTKRYTRNLRLAKEWNKDDVLQQYLNSLSHVYDPHSDYMGKPAMDQFAIMMNLSLFGIGAQLQSEDGFCTIQSLVPGGPAEKSKKIQQKDRIVAVAQGDQTPVDVVEMHINKVVQLIRGPKGTEVRLTIIPTGESDSNRKIVTLIRDKIALEGSEAKAKIIEVPAAKGNNGRLGVIDLKSFYAPIDVDNNRDHSDDKWTSVDVARLLKKLKEENVGGIILDLRGNGGGSLAEAIRLTGLFIKKGPVVQVREFIVKPNGSTDERITVDEDRDPSITYDGPLMVLTSRFSASASEIVAGALQDYGRALIVGDSSTHGKGTVQKVDSLKPYLSRTGDSATNEPGALKTTIAKFYRASGASTQLKGVMPDIVLPSPWNSSKLVGEKALDNPLPWDTIPAAKYDKVNMVETYLPELLKHSTERVATNRDFAYVREDIQIVRKLEADKTVSLNEKQRLKEKADDDARKKARDRERLARKEPEQKIYEITLKQVDLPGLPPPVQKTNSVAKNTPDIDAAGNVYKFSVSIGDEEEKAPPVDADLEEAKRIMMDYISLLPKDGVLTARQETPPAKL